MTSFSLEDHFGERKRIVKNLKKDQTQNLTQVYDSDSFSSGKIMYKLYGLNEASGCFGEVNSSSLVSDNSFIVNPLDFNYFSEDHVGYMSKEALRVRKLKGHTWEAEESKTKVCLKHPIDSTKIMVFSVQTNKSITESEYEFTQESGY
jgi:hypothetical protein